MRKPQRKRFFFAWAKSRFHAQNFAHARQHVGHTPKSFMAENKSAHSRLKQAANQLYYLQVLSKAVL